MTINKSNLVPQIYEEIKNEIFTNKLKLGEKISICEIANKYNVSYTPAREAIKNLIKDGLIIGSTNKVHRIVNISEKELFEVMEIRKMCEFFSIDKIIENFGQKEIDNINKQINKLNSLQFKKNKTIKDYYFSDIDFHTSLIKSTFNSKLLEIYSKISNISNIIIYRINNRLNISDIFFEQHINILKAILVKDNKKAKELLQKHIERSFKFYKDNFLN